MASNTLIDKYGTIGSGSQCLGVEIEVKEQLTDANPLAVGLGFFFGLVVGALIGLLCGKLCIKDISRSKAEDEENMYAAQNGYANHEKNKLLLTNAPSKKKKSTMRRRRKRGDEDEDVLVPAAVISLAAPAPELPEDPYAPQPGYYSSGPSGSNSGTPIVSRTSGSIGMVSALVQTNPGAMNAELANQDLEAVDELDRELREEGINTMVQMLRVMLAKEMARGGMSEDEYKELVTRMQDSVTGIVVQCQKEQEDEEEELKKKFSKNPEQLDNETQKLNAKYINRMNSLLKDERDRLRSDLNKSSKMTEDEIDALLAEFTDNMAGLEKKLGAERSRMAASLEDRLARRKALVEAHNMRKEQEKYEIEYRKDAHGKSLQSLVDDGKLMDRQKDEILDKFENDLRKIQMQQNQHIQEQQLKLADKLKERREAQQRKLAAQQEKEREEFIKRADKATSASDVTEAYHQMLSQHRVVRDELNDEMDNQEADAFDRLRRDNEKQRHEDIARREDELNDTIQSRCQLSQRDADRLMRIHQAEMDEYERMRKAEKKRMNAALEEKLEQRRLRAEEEQAKAAAEALALKEQQDTTIKRVLESQVELDDEARQRILKEHEQNTQAVNNQLQMSKLRQQKALEKRLAQRRAKVSELKQRQEEMEVSAKSEGKDSKKQVAELQKQIDTEETRLDKEKKDKLNELRQRLAAETEEALKEQERQIGLLIARLGVGAARRQAIIQNQSQTIKELEEQMANKVNEEGGGQKDWQVDHLIHEHQSQMEHLNDKLQDAKERQEQILIEKLQAKKLKKERELDREIEKEAQRDYDERRQSNAGMASSILANLMLEQRHKAAMQDLEKQMQVEMAKQREELNKELEEELNLELEEQKKSFLAQLAAISNVSKAEMNEIVENAVIDSGGDEQEAKKLSKEMRQELVRAKSTLGEQYERRRSSSYGRRDYGDEDDGYRRPSVSSRPASGRRRPPSAHRDY